MPALQAALLEENARGWCVACVWQHDEQQPAAIIMERSGAHTTHTSLVIDSVIAMRLSQRSEWTADFSAIDTAVAHAVTCGWRLAGVLTLPRVQGRASTGIVYVAVAIILQAPIDMLLLERQS